MATKTSTATALARQCQTAQLAKRKPTAAARLNDLEPRVDSLVTATAAIDQAVRQLDAEYRLLATDVSVLVEQHQLTAALARIEAIEARPAIPHGLLPNLQAQMVGFWIAIAAVGVAFGLILTRPPATPLPTAGQTLVPPPPTPSPTIKPNAKAAKPKL